MELKWNKNNISINLVNNVINKDFKQINNNIILINTKMLKKYHNLNNLNKIWIKI